MDFVRKHFRKFFALLNITDAVFDYILVETLFRKGYGRYGTLLAVGTSVALFAEFYFHFLLSREDLGDVRYEILFAGIIELIVFFVEDATTLLTWWHTGTYDTNDVLSKINLYTTVVSAISIGLSTVVFSYYNPKASEVSEMVTEMKKHTDGSGNDVMVPISTTVKFYHKGLLQLCLVFVVPSYFLGCIIFWTYVALGLVRNGEIAKSNETFNVTNITSMNDNMYWGIYGLNACIAIAAVIGILYRKCSS